MNTSSSSQPFYLGIICGAAVSTSAYYIYQKFTINCPLFKSIIEINLSFSSLIYTIFYNIYSTVMFCIACLPAWRRSL